MSKFGNWLKVEEEDGIPSVVPVHKIQVPNGTLTQDSTGVVSLDYLAQAIANLLYLKLDQSTPQNVVSGSPQFDEGITIKENKWVYLDGL